MWTRTRRAIEKDYCSLALVDNIRSNLPTDQSPQMLFTASTFLFAYLPLTILLFFAIGSFGYHGLAAASLLLASLVFYGWDAPSTLIPLILSSTTFNYFVGRGLSRSRRGTLLAIGVAGNLGLLGYFKYANFVAENLSALGITSPNVALPIGISFFTFTQIAFLVDCYRNEASEYNPIHYGLFVTFFPHLVAGPILHHKEMMPQFARPQTYAFRPDSLLVGLCWFAAGMFKKVIFADGIEPYASLAFDTAQHGHTVGFGQAWLSACGYALQLYFDFSGYSDMAIGLALMFGIVFPINFNSPGKATSLIDFWRRWHITLSRFLRDYLYIPLGGNRHGAVRRYGNLLATMLLGGLWHGAAWTFIVWGCLHGVGLLINHAWRSTGIRIPTAIGWIITAIFVILAWVPFRAHDMATTMVVWKSMLYIHGNGGNGFGWIWVAALGLIVLLAPNTNQLFHYVDEVKRYSLARYTWRPTVAWAAAGGLAFGVSMAAIFGGQPTNFLYFRF